MDEQEEEEDRRVALRLLDAIHAQYGCDLRQYAQPSLTRRLRLTAARFGLSSITELEELVLSDAELFSSLLDGISVPVSEMFRDPSFYLAFRHKVLDHLRTHPLLQIWHAGCAAGEEVYTMAILLSEEGLYNRAQLYATDLSPRAVRAASDGVYAASELPKFEDNYRRAGGTRALSEYYREGYGRIVMREDLRKNILFFQHDLVGDHTFGEMHVIFCRNVLIYFGTELRDKITTKLIEALRHGGFLCLGSSERPRSALLDEVTPDEPIYRRKM